MGKRQKKVWRAAPLCLFWTIRKIKNKRAFKIEEQSVQGLKYTFLCNLWDWPRLFLSYGPSSIVDLVDWVGSFLGGCSFLLVPPPLVCTFKRVIIYFLCTLEHCFGAFLLIIHACFTH